MARVTVEDCLRHVDNRFALVILAAQRARQISRGASPHIQCENKPPVVALREIAAGKVRFQEDLRNSIERYLQEISSRGRKTAPAD